MIKRTISLLVIIALIVGMIPNDTLSAKENGLQNSEKKTIVAKQLNDGSDAFDYSEHTGKEEKKLKSRVADAPSKYDLRNVDGESYVTPVKFQNPFGTCWGFAAVAAAESSLLGSGLAQETGYNSKTLNVNQGMNNNNNYSNNSYNQMNNDFFNNLSKQNSRGAPSNYMNKQISNEKNMDYNNNNSNEVNLNNMNNEFFPNDGDIKNNKMMEQNKQRYNNANRGGKTLNMHKKNKISENSNELLNNTDNKKNDTLEFNNDFLNKNKTIKISNKMNGGNNKMFNFSNTEIGNNKYFGNNYNNPINNKNYGYSNTESNLNDIYRDTNMLNKNKMNNINYIQKMKNRHNSINPNNKEAVLSKGSEDINNNYSNNSKDNNMPNNNFIKKLSSNDNNTINNNAKIVKLDSHQFNSPKTQRLNEKKVTKIRKLNGNESYQGFKNPMSQSMNNNNINNKLQDNYQMAGYLNKNAYNNQINYRGSFQPPGGRLNTGMNNQKYISLNSSQNQSDINFQIGRLGPNYSNIKPSNYNIQGNIQSNSVYGYHI